MTLPALARENKNKWKRDFRKGFPIEAPQIYDGDELSEEAKESLSILHDDFEVFSKECLKIKTKDGRMISFELNEPQKKVHEMVEKQFIATGKIRAIILKARREGVSTYVQGRLFHKGVMNPYITSLTAAHDAKSSLNIFEMNKTFYNHMPEALRPSKEYSTRQELTFNTSEGQGLNSKLMVDTAGNVTLGRSFTLQVFHASEVAFWDNAHDVMLAVKSAVGDVPGSMIFLESTANGVGGWFYDEWNRAIMGKSEYLPIFLPWFIFDEYKKLPPVDFKLTSEEEAIAHKFKLNIDQMCWRRWAIENLADGDLSKFRQEYPACVTGDTRVGTNLGLIRIDQADQAETATLGGIVKSHEQIPSKIFRLTTKCGYRLRGTSDHPIFLRDGSLMPLSELKLGTMIQLRQPRLADDRHIVKWTDFGVDHKIQIDEDWGRFLGYYMGDGSLCRDTLSIVCDAKDPDVIQDVSRLIKKIFGSEPHIRIVGSKRGGVEVRVTNKKFKPLFDRLGLIYRNGDQKIKRLVCVPEFIFCSPKQVVIEFLKGLFEADGFNDYRSPRIVLFSKNKDFLRNVQLLLLTCGVTGKLSSGERTNGNGFKYIANELILCGYRALEFQKNIGFISQRKINKSNPPHNKNATQNIFADEVLEVIEDGFEPTYNLTIEQEEAFDANGILTHNTPEEAFIVSGNPVFNVEILAEMIKDAEPPGITCNLVLDPNLSDFHEDLKPKLEPTRNGYVRIWRAPNRFHRYVIGADVASGVKDGDFSTGQVVDRNTWQVVAEWHGRIDPDLFGEELRKLAILYNRAFIGCEVNKDGLTVNRYLRDNYGDVYQRFSYDRTQDITVQKVGWLTNRQTKPIMINDLARMIRRKEIKLYNLDLLNELFRYIRDEKGEASASEGSFDDRVIALSIALQMATIITEYDQTKHKVRTMADMIQDDIASYQKAHADIEDEVFTEEF